MTPSRMNSNIATANLLKRETYHFSVDSKYYFCKLESVFTGSVTKILIVFGLKIQLTIYFFEFYLYTLILYLNNDYFFG